MKFAFVAAIISAVSAASLPYCPLPEPAQPEAPSAPAPPASSTAPAPPAPSSPGSSSSGFAVGDVVGIITIHSGSDVQFQGVGVNPDNKLGIHATTENVNYVLEKGNSDGTFQVKIQNTNNFLAVTAGYLEIQPSAGMDWTIDGSDLVLSTAGNRGFVVCPSDGNTIKYSSDNCSDPVGVALHLVKPGSSP